MYGKMDSEIAADDIKVMDQKSFSLSDATRFSRKMYINSEGDIILYDIENRAFRKISASGHTTENTEIQAQNPPANTDEPKEVYIAPPAGTTFIDIITHGSQRYIYFDSSNETQLAVTMRYELDGELAEETTAILGSPSNSGETTTWRDENGRFTFDVTDNGKAIFVTDAEGAFQNEYRLWKDPDGTEHPEIFYIDTP